MAPNTDYEYGVDFDRSDQTGSGVRYIGRSEMVEVVCYVEESGKPKAARPKTSGGNEKFARVKSPRMRERFVEEDVRPRSEKQSRKRTVTFNLDEPEVYPSFDSILPPIETRSGGKSGGEKREASNYTPRFLKQKSRSMDETTMTKLVPLDSPRSPKVSPKISRKASLRQKSESISVDNLATGAKSTRSQSRWERTESTLKKRNSFDSLTASTESFKSLPVAEKQIKSSPRSPPSSPRSPRLPASPRTTTKRADDKFIDLDNIDEYKPDKNRLKFIQAALSATTSPRFIRPGSGNSTSSAGGRSSPVSLGAISIDSDNASRTSCTFPELDAESSYSTGSRPSSPVAVAPPNSRVATAAGRKLARSWSKTKADLQGTITALLKKGKSGGGKWYD